MHRSKNDNKLDKSVGNSIENIKDSNMAAKDSWNQKSDESERNSAEDNKKSSSTRIVLIYKYTKWKVFLF